MSIFMHKRTGIIFVATEMVLFTELEAEWGGRYILGNIGKRSDFIKIGDL
jgi:hypothetical protein